jgi:hypothetical protein
MQAATPRPLSDTPTRLTHLAAAATGRVVLIADRSVSLRIVAVWGSVVAIYYAQ